MRIMLERVGLVSVAYLFKRMLEATKRSISFTWLNLTMAIKSKEIHCLTYQLSDENRNYLKLLVASITKKDKSTISKYFEEIEDNKLLFQCVMKKVESTPLSYKKDLRFDLGSVLGMYAIIRANKCEVVVENGIEAGYCSLVLCGALAKNSEEGYLGRYIGLDINPEAGLLLKDSPYEEFATIMIGDSIESLKKMEEQIDFYFSDGLRTYEYEKREFNVLKPKLTEGSVVISNKVNFSTALAELAEEKDRQFLYFQEKPANHWYQGNGIGFYYI